MKNETIKRRPPYKDPVNAIFCCCITDPWIEVAKSMKCKYGIHPSYYIHWDKDEAEIQGAGLYGCHYQRLNDAWRGVGFPEGTGVKSIDEEMHKKISHIENIAVKMMDRVDPLGENFSSSRRLDFFRRLLGRWLWVLEAREISLVISPSVPHRIFDYALFAACELTNTQFVCFQMTAFSGKSLVISGIEKVPVLKYADHGANDEGLLADDIIRQVEKIRGTYKAAEPDHMKKQAELARSRRGIFRNIKKAVVNASNLNKLFNSKPETYYLRKGCNPEESGMTWIEYLLTRRRMIRKTRALEADYKRRSTRDIPSEFVLVALHYQPEETTCPTGGSFCDQIMMVRLIDELAPKNLKILIREHPSQFYTENEGAAGRHLDYYADVLRISNRVSLVSLDTNVFELVDQAMAVATVSGTIGWESAVRGTPAFIFGRAWYENMPNVYKIKRRADLISAFERAPSHKGANIDRELETYLLGIQAHLVEATHYGTFGGQGGNVRLNSVAVIVDALAKHLGLSKCTKSGENYRA